MQIKSERRLKLLNGREMQRHKVGIDQRHLHLELIYKLNIFLKKHNNFNLSVNFVLELSVKSS